ncbi:hypothetical protein COCNU_scaffold019532G000060 [Cocos nucifera]|nr:hypothetical protein [Cocos nucifera]
MFRNKILVRVAPPDALSSSPFLLLPLSISLPFSPPSPSLSIELETLCWKLSRRWRLACLPQTSEIFIVYQRAQSESVAEVIKALAEAVPVSNQVQSEIDDDFVFLVSPDAFRFSRNEISDFVSSKMLERFDNGKEIVLEDYNICTACTILPSLCEGHVIGISKLLPAGEDFERLEELWSSWNFFDQGLVKLKEVSSLGTGMTLPVWNKATNSFPLCITRDKSSPYNEDSLNETYFFSKGLMLALDYRTPKPALKYSFGSRIFDSTEILKNAVPSNKNNANNSADSIDNGANMNSNIESQSPMKFLPVTKSIHSDLKVDQTQVPSFTKKKIEDIRKGKTPRISNDQGLTKEKEMCGESYMKENQLEPVDGISMQLDRSNLHSSAKGSEKKEKADAFLGGNCLPNPGEVPQKDAWGKRTLNSEKKINSMRKS